MEEEVKSLQIVNEATCAEMPVIFPEPPPQPPPCSFDKCGNGHVWPVVASITPCPGCKCPVLVMLMTNCPVCNEPTAISILRSDHIMNKGGVAAQCMGQKNNAEVAIVEMERMHSKQVEEEAGTDAGVEWLKRTETGVKK